MLGTDLKRLFDWDVANFKGVLTATVSFVPAVLTLWQFGPYNEQNAVVWWLAFAIAAPIGGAALWCGFAYEWRQLRSLKLQARKEALEARSIGERTNG